MRQLVEVLFGAAEYDQPWIYEFRLEIPVMPNEGFCRDRGLDFIRLREDINYTRHYGRI